MVFKVEVTETLQRTVEIEADDPHDAVRKAIEMYQNEEIVLDTDDYVDTTFDIKKEDEL